MKIIPKHKNFFDIFYIPPIIFILGQAVMAYKTDLYNIYTRNYKFVN